MDSSLRLRGVLRSAPSQMSFRRSSTSSTVVAPLFLAHRARRRETRMRANRACRLRSLSSLSGTSSSQVGWRPTSRPDPARFALGCTIGFAFTRHPAIRPGGAGALPRSAASRRQGMDAPAGELAMAPSLPPLAERCRDTRPQTDGPMRRERAIRALCGSVVEGLKMLVLLEKRGRGPPVARRTEQSAVSQTVTADFESSGRWALNSLLGGHVATASAGL
jgi:hypothetical protein